MPLVLAADSGPGPFRWYQQSATLAVDGDLDYDSAPRLVAAVRARLTPGAKPLNLDLSKVPFCDSAGIGALLAVCRAATDAHVRLAIFCTSRPVLRVLELTGLLSILNVQTGRPPA